MKQSENHTASQKADSWLHLLTAGFDSDDTQRIWPLYFKPGMRSPLKTSLASSDWRNLLRKVFSDLTLWTCCIFVLGGSSSTWWCPPHERGGAPSQSSLHLFTDSRGQEFEVERLCRVGSPCKGKSVSSPAPIVSGRLRHEVICRSERESAGESTTSGLNWNLNSPHFSCKEIN